MGAALPKLLHGESVRQRDLPRPGPKVTSRMYAVDVAALRNAPPVLADTFARSWRDASTSEFLARAARAGRDGRHVKAEHAAYEVYVRAQRQGMGRTDARALHFGHEMMVASAAQIRHLLSRAGTRGALPARTLLDVGAGRGEVTAALAAGLGVPAPSVAAIEASAPLRTRLTDAMGYRACSSFGELGAQVIDAIY